MGSLFSCCRKRRLRESEPLLPKHMHTGEPSGLPTPTTQFERLANILAAFKAGRLPSQDQVTRALQLVLQSRVLDVGYRDGDYGKLSELGREVVADMREAVEALIQMGLEKNIDDKLQDFVYQCHVMDPVPVHADIASDASRVSQVARELLTEDESTRDVKNLLNSLLCLVRVTITSVPYRAILSDLSSFSREMLADVASDVGHLAAQVQIAATEVEGSVRPRDSSEDAKAKEPVLYGKDERATYRDTSQGKQGPVSDILIVHAQELITYAHQDPAFYRALQTIIGLLRRYASRARRVTESLSDTGLPSVSPVVWAEPPLASALEDLKTLLERMASGRSLDGLLQSLSIFVIDITNVPAEVAHDSESRHELEQYFGCLSTWIDNALSDVQYISSAEGQRSTAELYDSGKLLVRGASESHAEWLDHFRSLAQEIDAFVTALQSDRTTQRVLRALNVLSTATVEGPSRAREAQQRWRKQLQRDILVWLVPRILRVVKAIPLPRVEYVSKSVDAAVDALLVSASGAGTSTAASLVPDRIRVANYSEIQVQVDERDSQGAGSQGLASALDGTSAYTRVRVHIDGVRVAARDIGYYVCYKGWRDLIGYEDQGLLSIEVGEPQARGQGISIDVELEFEGELLLQGTDSPVTGREGDTTRTAESLFQVTDVKADVPGLRFSVDRSKHRIINKLFLQPLAGPVARAVAGYVLARQIRTLLEAGGRFGASVKRRAEELHTEARPSTRDTSFEDYWQATVQAVSRHVPDEDNEDKSIDEDNDVRAESHTTATLKGVVHTTVTQSSPEASRPPTPDETVIAVGVAPQILPGKGGPTDVPDEYKYSARNVAREASDEVQGLIENAGENLEQVVESAVEAGIELDEAVERTQMAERSERRKKGWRSRAFEW